MSKNHICGCKSTGKSCSPSCGCYPKEGESITITFTDNQTHNCNVLAKITIDDNKYLVLQHPNKNQQLLYRYTKDNGTLTLDEIYDKEFDLVARAYESTIHNKTFNN